MRLEQIEAFIAVSETGNFQKAAQKCGVTQPTISRQVQSLEADLGIQLFHRHSPFNLTIAGKCFLARAQKICHEWHSATEELVDLLAGKQQELCIAAIPSVCAYHMPPILQKFCQAYPEVQLRLTALGSDRALKVLKDGLIDIAVVMSNRFISASPEIVVDCLYKETVRVLMAANHPLTKYKAIPWKELAVYPHIVFKDGYATQRLVLDQFRAQQVKLDAVLELNSLDAFRGVVRQGNFIALLPHTAMAGVEQDATLAVRDTEFPHITSEVVLVTTSDRLQVPPIQYFRKLVNELMSNTSTRSFTQSHELKQRIL